MTDLVDDYEHTWHPATYIEDVQAVLGNAHEAVEAKRARRVDACMRFLPNESADARLAPYLHSI
jgi:hypothetical protein